MVDLKQLDVEGLVAGVERMGAQARGSLVRETVAAVRAVKETAAQVEALRRLPDASLGALFSRAVSMQVREFDTHSNWGAYSVQPVDVYGAIHLGNGAVFEMVDRWAHAIPMPKISPGRYRALLVVLPVEEPAKVDLESHRCSTENDEGRCICGCDAENK